MKPLQNPYVVITLAVVALLLVFRGFLESGWHRLWAKSKSPAVAVAPAAPPDNKPPPTPPQTVEPEVSIDATRVGWIRPPRRDPFRSTKAPSTNALSTNASSLKAPSTNAPSIPRPATQVSGPRAREVLELKAVWLQESGGWAVINGQVLGVGDSVLGFRVKKIRADGVLVQGPYGDEDVGFKGDSAPPSQPAAATNAPAKLPPPPARGRTAGP